MQAKVLFCHREQDIGPTFDFAQVIKRQSVSGDRGKNAFIDVQTIVLNILNRDPKCCTILLGIMPLLQ